MDENEHRDQERERSGRDSHYTLGLGTNELKAIIALQRLGNAQIDRQGHTVEGVTTGLVEALRDVPSLTSFAIYYSALLLTGKMTPEAAFDNALGMVEDQEGQRTMQLIQAITNFAGQV